MLSGSPLEILFDLGSAPLGHTLLGLALLAAVVAIWVFLHRDPALRRYGGALVFLAIAFAAEIVIPDREIPGTSAIA